MIFWTKFAQKACFNFKIEKVDTTNKFCIFELALEPNFSLHWQFWFSFDQICPKTVFPVENGKITLVLASMDVTYYIKLFRTGTNRHNGILMSLLHLVAETIIDHCNTFSIGKGRRVLNIFLFFWMKFLIPLVSFVNTVLSSKEKTDEKNMFKIVTPSRRFLHYETVVLPVSAAFKGYFVKSNIFIMFLPKFIDFFFASATWLSLSQLWSIIDGIASLTRCWSLRFY